MRALPWNRYHAAKSAGSVISSELAIELPSLARRFGTALPKVPASFFGMVLGLGGLGFTWRSAHQIWPVPESVGEALMAVAAAVWAVLLVLYALKWAFARDEALAEAQHPIQCCFIGWSGFRPWWSPAARCLIRIRRRHCCSGSAPASPSVLRCGAPACSGKAAAIMRRRRRCSIYRR
ncbi:MAG: hypothetical protein WDN69_13160 [Aliidongia sp.]